MPVPKDRNPDSAPGDWYIDSHCIDCGASCSVAPGLIVRRNGKSVFARQPENADEETAAWRAVLVCPTASVGTLGHHRQPADLFPQQLAPGVFRCGYNARSSYGAHSYLALRRAGNVLIDSPRFTAKLVRAFAQNGGSGAVFLTSQGDRARANR